MKSAGRLPGNAANSASVSPLTNSKPKSSSRCRSSLIELGADPLKDGIVLAIDEPTPKMSLKLLAVSGTAADEAFKRFAIWGRAESRKYWKPLTKEFHMDAIVVPIACPRLEEGALVLA